MFDHFGFFCRVDRLRYHTGGVSRDCQESSAEEDRTSDIQLPHLPYLYCKRQEERMSNIGTCHKPTSPPSPPSPQPTGNHAHSSHFSPSSCLRADQKYYRYMTCLTKYRLLHTRTTHRATYNETSLDAPLPVPLIHGGWPPGSWEDKALSFNCDGRQLGSCPIAMPG